MKTGVKVGDAMTTRLICIKPSTTIKQVARIMQRRRIGGVLITHGKRLLGIATEADIVAVIARGVPLGKRIESIMVKNVRCLHPNEDIYGALRKMKHYDFRRMPVVHEGRLVGYLTERDIFRIQPQLVDLMYEKGKAGIAEKGKREYFEGYCESCGMFARLYDSDGELLCENCVK